MSTPWLGRGLFELHVECRSLAIDRGDARNAWQGGHSLLEVEKRAETCAPGLDLGVADGCAGLAGGGLITSEMGDGCVDPLDRFEKLVAEGEQLAGARFWRLGRKGARRIAAAEPGRSRIARMLAPTSALRHFFPNREHDLTTAAWRAPR